MLSLLRYEIASRRGAIIGWSVGLTLYVMMYMAFYPALPPEMMQVDLSGNELYQAFGTFNMSTFEGYFSSAILGFLATLIAIYAVIDGTGTLAGQEESGVLELIVTLPLKRWQVVIAKASAIALAVLIMLLVAGLSAVLTFALIQSQVETSLTPIDMLPPIINTVPITLLFAMISLFLSALLPQRRHAGALAAVVVVFSYFGNNLLPLVEAMEPLTNLLPFHYYDTTATVFSEGIQLGDSLLLLAAALVFLLLAVAAFTARNLTVGRWAWARGKAEVV